jgi:YhcH/YjgK/YiaL family protein
MIKDKLNNATTYCNISENLKIGFDWLKNTDLKLIADGKYTISDNVYANVQSYETKDDAPFEAHKKYIDIQYMIEGEEFVEIADYNNTEITVDYDSVKDIEFLKCNKQKDIFRLQAGSFLVLFPQDAHKPALNPNKKLFVKKVIVKVGI